MKATVGHRDANAAAAGGLVGAALFERVDPARFRRIVFALLFCLGTVLLARG